MEKSFRTRTKRTFIFYLCLSLFLVSTLVAQQSVLTLVASAGEYERFDSPVSLSLEDIQLSTGGNQYVFFERTSNGLTPTNFQIEQGMHGRLWWILSGHTAAGEKRVFELHKNQKNQNSNSKGIEVKKENGTLVFRQNGKNILAYQYEEVMPPEGASKLFQRGGFIHPLWSPKGEVLTRIQPPDHIHHYGIWNPWTKTTFEGQQLDFWNLYKGEGTVSVSAYPLFSSGSVFGKTSSQHEHLVLDPSNKLKDKAALNEEWQIKTWASQKDDAPHIIDFSSTLYCATGSNFTINAYRYQGFGFRATEKWDDNTAQLLTSEGKDKSNGNATRARWIDTRGISEFGQSGILFMTHPLNHDFPEKLRIWPTGANEGKENVFINFNPAQDNDWILEPGNAYSSNFRMIVYDGELTAEQMENYWQDYANPAKVEVILNRVGKTKNVLVYTKNGEGFVHDNIKASVEAIKNLGEKFGFNVDVSDSPSDFTEKNLQKYQAVVFSNTNNEAFDTKEQKLAFQRYIQAGGGFAGIHSACGSERQWPWYWKLIGGKFRRHPPLQAFDIEVINPFHPSTLHLPEVWLWEDECYYLNQLNPANEVLLAAKLNTVEDEKMEEYPANTFGKFFPLSWSRQTGIGRVWYTALGHKIEYYSDADFLQRLAGGILWVLEGTNRLDYTKATQILIAE